MSAFAVFCADDGSLIFYNRDTVPTAGDEFEGKVASNVYTGFDTVSYASYNSTPWYNERTSILSVSFMPEFATVKPISAKYWFNGFKNMTSFDGASLDTSNVTNMCQMFHSCSNLTSLDVTNFNTSNVIDMSNMFYYCRNLISLDVSNFDTSKVTNMSYMFYDCATLTSLDLSNFDTSKVTNMEGMFRGCKILTLDTSNFDTSNVTNMSFMFYLSNKLTSLNLNNFDTSKVTDMSYMFGRCSSLTTIYVSELWTTAAVTNSTNMFDSCTNLVGAIPYDSSNINVTYATYDGGYLTYKFYFDNSKNRFVVSGVDLNRIANAIRDKIETIYGLSFPDGFITAIESIKVTATDDGNGNVIIDSADVATTYNDGNVVIS